MPREILVHLNVETCDEDKRSAQLVAADIVSALHLNATRSLLAGAKINSALAEEIGTTPKLKGKRNPAGYSDVWPRWDA